MASERCHTVKAFDADLLQIRAMVCQAGGLAEMALHDTIAALLGQDAPSPGRARHAHSQIHLLAREIEKRCICLIALRAPVADDLKAVLASFQVAILIDRIGDHALGIAEQIARVPRYTLRSVLALLRSAATEVSSLVRAALDSFAGHDAVRARLVCDQRDRIRSLNEQLLRALLGTSVKDEEDADGSCSLLIISAKLDRIGEDAVDIGKAVYFLCAGERCCEGSAVPLPEREHI